MSLIAEEQPIKRRKSFLRSTRFLTTSLIYVNETGFELLDGLSRLIFSFFNNFARSFLGRLVINYSYLSISLRSLRQERITEIVEKVVKQLVIVLSQTRFYLQNYSSYPRIYIFYSLSLSRYYFKNSSINFFLLREIHNS